jgi:hypothetical protein
MSTRLERLMLTYDIVEPTDPAPVTLARFKAPWAVSVPIFHNLARAYFAGRQTRPADRLDLYATLEDESEPDRTALVCSARSIDGESGKTVEIRAGPLLEVALRARRH